MIDREKKNCCTNIFVSGTMDKIDQISNEIDKEIKSIWMYNQREKRSDEMIYDSDVISCLPDSNSDLFDLESIESIGHKQPATCRKKMNLQIVKLESISIASTAQTPHIVNLKQSFTFPAVLKPSQPISTQTSQIDLMKPCKPTLNDETATVFRHFVKRPTSLPPENVALTNLEKRVKADVKPTLLGDGDKTDKDVKVSPNDMGLLDLELSPSPVQCVMNQHKKSTRLSTPSFNCKKVLRPQTKYTKKRFIESKGNDSIDSTGRSDQRKSAFRVSAKNEGVKPLGKKPDNSMNNKTSSDTSADYGFNTGGSLQVKLLAIVDKLHDQDWEICIAGMKSFVGLARSIDWESELGQKFIPILSRKLIDFFKSPRSNLCRTACQTAGEFFVLAKSTKRPEFDEMVDILICKTADPNRFIQKDAIVSLDKMAKSICVHHSVRAVCSKAPDNKNSVVRASTARVLYHICKNAGVDAIIGCNANPRTRKRVLSNLAKFLVDKNQDTRRNAEKLCKMLKRHKFFVEYFFKDIENNFKNTLRKIVNSLDAK